MLSFKEFYNLQNDCHSEILEEGKYLNLIKHFLIQLYRIRKLSIEVADRNNKRFRDRVRGMEMGNDTNKLAADCRALIESLPEKFQGNQLASSMKRSLKECLGGTATKSILNYTL